MAFEAKLVAEYNSKNRSSSLKTAKTLIASDKTVQKEMLSNTTKGTNKNYCSVGFAVTDFKECDKIKSLVTSLIFIDPVTKKELEPQFTLWDSGTFSVSFFVGEREVYTLEVSDRESESESKTD